MHQTGGKKSPNTKISRTGCCVVSKKAPPRDRLERMSREMYQYIFVRVFKLVCRLLDAVVLRLSQRETKREIDAV